jgi:hypothetical protein
MCDDLGIDNKKVRTYRLSLDAGCFLVDSSLDGIIETLRSELEVAELNGSPVEYSIAVEEIYTQSELDKMPEFDGF